MGTGLAAAGIQHHAAGGYTHNRRVPAQQARAAGSTGHDDLTLAENIYEITRSLSEPKNSALYVLRGKISHSRTPIFRANQISGSIGLRRLINAGAITMLDNHSFFVNVQAASTQGRAAIIQSLLPYNAIACGLVASWIWGGGDFPRTIDIISRSHFRTPIYGRAIRVTNRDIPQEHLSYLGTQRLTSPVRTACDLACLSISEKAEEKAYLSIGRLAGIFNFTYTDCLKMLWDHPRWPGHDEGVICFSNPQLRAILDAQRERYLPSGNATQIGGHTDQRGKKGRKGISYDAKIQNQ